MLFIIRPCAIALGSWDKFKFTRLPCSRPIALPYFECLIDSHDLVFQFAQEVSVDNSMKMRMVGGAARGPRASRLHAQRDPVITLTGSPLGLEPTNLTLILNFEDGASAKGASERSYFLVTTDLPQ